MPKLETGIERWDEFFQTSWWRDMVLLTKDAISEVEMEMDNSMLQDMGIVNHLRGQKVALRHFLGLEGRMNKITEETNNAEDE